MSPRELAQIFVERKTNILIGSLLQCICWCFYGTWAVPIVLFIRKMKRGMPALTDRATAGAGAQRTPSAAIASPVKKRVAGRSGLGYKPPTGPLSKPIM